ncbi:MAG: HD domain-containing protein [Clostridia bacterium]|nr:HD domain-containing protein [Clostridia bacterium]
MAEPKNLSLPGPVETALSLLEAGGYEAYVVGGCTRDSLLGTVPDEWDITTSALPEQTLEVFRDYRTIETGLQHGTVTVRIDKTNLEITTYRVDGKYEDSRHPDAVTFTRSLSEDLARRDFTMNAIAYSPTRGWKDLYGGAEDIEDHLIRCVGDPETRFTEDALRVLRALRFSSVLGFEIEGKTANAIHALKHRINFVAYERIAVELLKLLCGKNVYRVLQDYRDVFAVILPEMEPCFDFEQHNPWHIYDVYTHIAKSVEAVRPEPELRLAMLLHDIGKPETFFLDEKGIGHFYGHPAVSARMADSIALRLRLSNAMKKEVTTLVEFHDSPLEPDRKMLRRRLNKFGKTTLWNLLEVNRADLSAQNPEKAGPQLDKLRTIEETLELLLRENPAFKVADLEVDGEDLIALGMHPGPEVGKLLKEILEKVMAEELPNDRFRLLDYIAGKVL